MSGDGIADSVRRVVAAVREAERKAGVPEGDVHLVAASKLNGAERVRLACQAGIREFGENRVRELLDKQAADAYGDCPVHFIGHLQRNKVRQVTGRCALIQSVDSFPLMELISRQAVNLGIVQDGLVEVNIGQEASKSGVKPEALDELLGKAFLCPGIRVRGLMAIPPAGENPTGYFQRMRNLYIDMGGKKYDNVRMCILSMGMSADYAAAISAGSNMVRVGSAIFGSRTQYDTVK